MEESDERYDNATSPWIPVTERLPEEEGRYLVVLNNGDRWICEFDVVRGFHLAAHKAESWMPLP